MKKDPVNRSEKLHDALQRRDYAAAIDHLRQSVAEAAAADHWGTAARQLGLMAILYEGLARHEEALDCLDEALRFAYQDGDPVMVGKVRGSQGVILREIGRLDEAFLCLEEALQIAERTDDQSNQGRWQDNLGLLFKARGEHALARDQHVQALAIAREFSDGSLIAERLCHLADSLIDLGDAEGAQAALEEALGLYRIAHMHAEIAQVAAQLGNLYALRGFALKDINLQAAVQKLEHALSYFGNALALAEAYGREDMLAGLHDNIQYVLDAFEDLVDYLN
ncbi:MAG TPA: tetratricopeptide repeat protein [Aggregatilineales bacterium]|jgi:tetratricopeptide (TPR) repeat protein|nr:tetratricopeptide repeat protein [Aggregatilineales bacterium]